MSSANTAMTGMSPSFHSVPSFASSSNQHIPPNAQCVPVLKEISDLQPGVGRFLLALSRNLCNISQRRSD